jgi:hypothetical protein
MAEPHLDLLKHALDLLFLRDRGPNRIDREPGCLQFLLGFAGGIVRMEVVDDDVRASFGQLLHDHPADAFRASGHQSELSCQILHVLLHLSSLSA